MRQYLRRDKSQWNPGDTSVISMTRTEIFGRTGEQVRACSEAYDIRNMKRIVAFERAQWVRPIDVVGWRR
jgi:hypothetical protein